MLFVNIKKISIRTLCLIVVMTMLLPFAIALLSVADRSNKDFSRYVEETDLNLLNIGRLELDDEMQQIDTFITNGFSSNPNLLSAASTMSPIGISVHLQGWLSEFNARMLNLKYTPYACVYDRRSDRFHYSYTNPVPSDTKEDLKKMMQESAETETPTGWRIVTVGGLRYLFCCNEYRSLVLGSLIPVARVLEAIRGTFSYQTAYFDIGYTDRIPEIHKDRALLSTPIPEAGLSLWMTVDKAEMRKNMPLVQSLLTGVAYLFLCTLPVMYLFLQRHVIRPLNHIDRALSMADSGDLEHRISAHNYAKEFVHINTSFNQMMDSIIDLKLSNYENEIRFQQHELINLQLQIKPHFLYNTFHDISSLAMIHDYEGIQFMMRNLADYFRYSVRTGFCLVPLEREMSFLHSYLNIMSLRYDGCFSFSADIAPDVEKLTIPPLLIHTFIENIMSHTIRVGNFITILMTAKREGNYAVIEIRDDGDGIPPDKLKAIYERRKYTDEFGKEHVGIWNCFKRLDCFYGEKAEIRIQSKVAEGTAVFIRIPYSEEETDVRTISPGYPGTV